MEFTGERFFPEVEGQIALEHYNRYYFVVNQIDLTNKVVLDLASGEGYGSELLAKCSKQVFGVDISEATIEHAKSKYEKDNLTFIIGSALNIPLPDNSIDVTVSFETIEHHENHEEMIEEIKRVLKKDGILIISSPDKLNYADLPNYNNPFHVKELYFEEFSTLLKRYFILTYFFSQRFFIGSVIAFNNNYQDYKEPLVINKDGSSAPFTPIYNIAIATNNDSFKLNNLIVFYKEDDNMLSIEDLDKERNKGREEVYNSLSYRVGFFFINPLKKIIRAFNLERR